MLKKILLVVVVLVVVLVGVVMMQPAEFRISRSATVNAPPATVFAQVNDFRAWDAWSPWAKLDPAMKVTHEGPAAGAGAIYRWAGNDDVGEGNMTITESRENERVLIRLEFLKPFASVNTTEFTFAPVGAAGGTNVTWTMAGTNDFMGKAFSLAMDMDSMIGADFDKGLAAMKSVAEAKAAAK